MTGMRAALPMAAALSLGFVVASHHAARAASFDCTKAATVRERLVCSDPELSKLDTEVGQLYRQALSQLSPDGGQRLRVVERQWLVYLNAACPLPTAPDSNESKNCLQNAYYDRVADLKLAAVRQGPFLFTRVDLYRATMPPPEDSDSPSTEERRPALLHVAYPQIDQPVDTATGQWNKLAVRGDPGTDCESPGDVTVIYKLGLATKRLISVTWTNWEYCHGTPHGHGGNHAENTILSPVLRPLQPVDLFQQDRPWNAKLTALLRVAVEKKARDDGDSDLSHLDISAVVNAAGSPKRWSLKEDGLEVDFDPYELGEGYPFAPEVNVPWSALKEVLAGPPD